MGMAGCLLVCLSLLASEWTMPVSDAILICQLRFWLEECCPGVPPIEQLRYDGGGGVTAGGCDGSAMRRRGEHPLQAMCGLWSMHGMLLRLLLCSGPRP